MGSDTANIPPWIYLGPKAVTVLGTLHAASGVQLVRLTIIRPENKDSNGQFACLNTFSWR